MTNELNERLNRGWVVVEAKRISNQNQVDNIYQIIESMDDVSEEDYQNENF